MILPFPDDCTKHPGESNDAWETRGRRQARDQKLAEVQAFLLKHERNGDPQSALYFAVEALSDLMEDLLEP